ncbi:nucleotide disphospho-sugar-binding domain-containing protein [Dactylosporangium matsuzakiense]|uniref:Glycosyl transferase n=1 Tax=Dactylosporangium matsuzakiense TaxID=53360 RepID=A0A9W6KIX4_9ACTN|nr:nucleotide disphospho-sugar-binding domain-containing protein [Dactylosporangium matsuzakiense]UWZ45893.1 DUF1205 domain-containing protein [Dactylosporangium matsuzakiense]GLL02942.1 glycosyl transferase [Dactylosporangium matsuzakiense]
MRVLFIPAAVSSHHYPMVSLAWGFRSAGHEVYVAGQPPVVDSVVSTGLTAVPVGAAYDLLGGITAAADQVRAETGEGPAPTGDLSAMSPAARHRYAELRTAPHVRAAAAMAADLTGLARHWAPDLVVSDPITMVAPLVASVAGAPLVHHLWGPQPASLPKFPGYGAPLERWPLELLRLYREHGVTPRERRGIATVDPGPASLQPASVPDRIAARYMCYNGPGALPDWLLAPPSRPRVVISWLTANTLTDTAAEHPVAALARAVGRLDVEVVVTVRAADRAALDIAQDRVRVVQDLPLNALMPGCAVAVNHGGTGTALTAACHGVPQVIAPYNPGLSLNAEALGASGAAIALPAASFDPQAVADAVATVLADEVYAKAADTLRAENQAQPTPIDVVRTIEDMTLAGATA